MSLQGNKPRRERVRWLEGGVTGVLAVKGAETWRAEGKMTPAVVPGCGLALRRGLGTRTCGMEGKKEGRRSVSLPSAVPRTGSI